MPLLKKSPACRIVSCTSGARFYAAALKHKISDLDGISAEHEFNAFHQCEQYISKRLLHVASSCALPIDLLCCSARPAHWRSGYIEFMGNFLDSLLAITDAVSKATLVLFTKALNERLVAFGVHNVVAIV
jgi:hypothetical protein